VGSTLLASFIFLVLVATLLLLHLWPLLEEAPRAGKDSTGSEGLLGMTATVTQPFSSASDDHSRFGRVQVRGENWTAKLHGQDSDATAVGEQVTIVGVEGLCLTVRPVEETAGAPVSESLIATLAKPHQIVRLLAAAILTVLAGIFVSAYATDEVGHLFVYAGAFIGVAAVALRFSSLLSQRRR
jgi:membrane protein implicated in regulation of membrane protease activity